MDLWKEQCNKNQELEEHLVKNKIKLEEHKKRT